MKTHCDAGCKKLFNAERFDTDKLHDDIERVSFTCPHCDRRYVAFYTDTNIRQLQSCIRRVQRRFAVLFDNHDETAKKEAKLQWQIKEKMDALRQRVEGERMK